MAMQIERKHVILILVGDLSNVKFCPLFIYYYLLFIFPFKMVFSFSLKWINIDTNGLDEPPNGSKPRENK